MRTVESQLKQEDSEGTIWNFLIRARGIKRVDTSREIMSNNEKIEVTCVTASNLLLFNK